MQITCCVQTCAPPPQDIPPCQPPAATARPVALGGSYVTHWHQPLLPVGPLPVALGDRFLLEAVHGGEAQMIHSQQGGVPNR